MADWSDLAPFALALIECDPSRLLWGSNWPHPAGGTGGTGGGDAGAVRHPGAVGEQIALERLASWVKDQAVLERILVHNPTELFAFAD